MLSELSKIARRSKLSREFEKKGEEKRKSISKTDVNDMAYFKIL